MARSQFSFQKRQKELAKKKKQEEKRARREARKEAGSSGPEIATVNEFGEVIEPDPVETDADDEAEADRD
jgi:hypothetical protein